MSIDKVTSRQQDWINAVSNKAAVLWETEDSYARGWFRKLQLLT